MSEEVSVCFGSPRAHDYAGFEQFISYHSEPPSLAPKKKRNQPGSPDPDAEVVALSPGTLMATNRFLCEICDKRFQRDQNLQLHRRGHNLPWKLRQSGKEVVQRKKKRKVYVCPEESCIHHHPSRALGDLTGIKKHFSRKHGEKKWKCERCSKAYAVMSDWKAHSKTCGTREYRCNCGTIFSRKDSFITHRAFCEALAEESARVKAAAVAEDAVHASTFDPVHYFSHPQVHIKPPALFLDDCILSRTTPVPHHSAIAILEKAEPMWPLASATAATSFSSACGTIDGTDAHTWASDGCPRTRDFLGVARIEEAAKLLPAAGGEMCFSDPPRTEPRDVVSVPTVVSMAPARPHTSVGSFAFRPCVCDNASGAWGGVLLG